jgi:hypothetical protein
MALTVIRKAAELEGDLQEHIERDLMHGQFERAKQTTRLQHRISRSRIGLALLGNLPATG